MARLRLTQALVASDVAAYRKATQSAFLRDAARGEVSKHLLGRWLANDRLYIHGYIKGVGRLLSFLSLPEAVPEARAERKTPATRLLSWMIDALVNIRREEAFFVDTAAAFGIPLEGLRRFEALFDGLAPGDSGVLPWLECAVVYYGTERCYLDAWSYARSHLKSDADVSGDLDGGAVRREFIPNWTSAEFVTFVDELGDIIDDAVDQQVALHGESIRSDLMERSLVQWRALLAAEEAFWHVTEGRDADCC
ncbi:transcription regulator [Hirsutella rhossiliensis]|uniref:Transcription regulator n=1 Tax=Hirsutella rhossiliensis TaxID=111463 RepID=A0A9P8MT33_9HYPO|nr:transcription regulator [Hirsutella rhossiliensis]KAH0959924.1 transcription regulator [Hirsutella rhossiliensis]